MSIDQENDPGIMWKLLVCVLCSPPIFALAYSYHESNHDRWYQPVVRRPVDVVTDVVNDLGVRILQQYAGHGNVAFSPTGVGFVLAALYEGSAGRGSLQIENALGLPRDRDVTRIGFRDVHRRLRTYLNADGFLGGLTLNKANTALRPEYEDILRFYGFDLSSGDQEMNVTMPPELAASTQGGMNGNEENGGNNGNTENTENNKNNGNTGNNGNAENNQNNGNMATNGDNGDPTTNGATENTPNLENSSTAETNPDETEAPTTSGVEILETTMNTGPSSRLTQTSTGPPIPSSQLTQTANSETTPQSVVPVETTPSIVSTTISGETTTVSPLTIAAQATEATTQTIETTVGSLDAQNAESAAAGSTGSATSLAMSTTTDSVIMETTTTIGTSTTTSMEFMDGSTTVIDDVQTTTQAGMETITVSGLADGSTVPMDSGTDSVTTIDAAEFSGQTTVPSVASPVTDDSMNRIRKRSVRSPRGYFSSYPDEGIWMQDLGIWKAYPTSTGEASVRDSTEISFLVNGCDLSSVSATRYIAVLPFAYFPSLHAIALEFPLDDPRYNVLLLMPTDRSDTHRLARDLDGKSLRLLRKQLQPTWVRATIPSFMLRGFVTLTPFLQRLGIIDVFEPRVADLSPMTTDLGVYARDVQQSIGVNIRNYMKPDRTHSRNGLFERAGPVPFTALHPFLYFIIDAETSVTLIAGRVEDPLNSRIL